MFKYKHDIYIKWEISMKINYKPLVLIYIGTFLYVCTYKDYTQLIYVVYIKLYCKLLKSLKTFKEHKFVL